MVKLDDTRTRIISAAIRAVRQHGLEGVRIQNVSSLAGVSPGALYRYFESKEKLLEECFTYVDRQAAAIFDQLAFDPHAIVADPVGAVKSLWLPHPDETVFYHRIRDSAFFPEYDRTRDISYFGSFVCMVQAFQQVFPGIRQINQDLLWLHVLTTTVLYAKYVAEGVLRADQETEETVFQLLATGLSDYLRPETGCQKAAQPCLARCE